MARRQGFEFIIRARDRASRVLERVRDRIRGVGRAARGIGKGLAVAAGLFGALAKRALDFATSFEAASRRVNASAETLQGLKVLGDDIGVAFDTTVSVMQRLQSNAGAAIGGNDTLLSYFQALGISLAELKELDGEGLLLRVADATKTYAGDTKVLQDTLRKIGDTEIVRLIPLLEQGSQSIREQIKGLKEAGALLSNEQTRAAAEKEAAVRREILVLQTRLNDQVLSILPALIRAATVLAALVEKTGKFLGETTAKGVIAASPVARKIEELRERSGVAGANDRIALESLGALNPELAPGIQRGMSEGRTQEMLKAINDSIRQQTTEMRQTGVFR